MRPGILVLVNGADWELEVRFAPVGRVSALHNTTLTYTSNLVA